MRTVTLALLAAISLNGVSTARAADLDYDFLRGPDYDPAPVAVDWSGVYLGGHGGYTSGAMAQRQVLKSRLEDYFRYTTVEQEFGVSKLIALPGSRSRGASYGVFAGYNVQFDDVVVGFEADYTHFGQSSSSTNGIGRIMTTSQGIEETLRITGRSKTEIGDYGTVRARAGYAMGSFLPFITGGLAIGQATVQDTATVQSFGYDARTYAANQALPSNQRLEVYNHGYRHFEPTSPINGSDPAPADNLVATKSTKTIAGVALGAGLEYALTPNILLRGEYQYVLFQSFNGHRAELNTIRGGAAVKF